MASQGGNANFNGNLGIPSSSVANYNFRKENTGQQQLRMQTKQGIIPMPQSSMVYL
jgi:hypothetical protein